MTRSQIQQQFPGFEITPQIDGQGWWGNRPFETEDTARQRAARVLTRAVAEFAHTQERVAFVTHADFKQLLLEQFHSEPLGMPYNTSVTKIVLSDEGCRLDDYSCVDHLPGDLVTM